MSLHAFPDVIQGTDEWHDQRRGIVTASAVDKLVSIRNLTAIDYDCPACGATPLSPCLSTRDATPIKSLHPGRATVARDTNTTVVSAATGDEARGLALFLVAERITDYTELTYVGDAMLRGIEDEPRARDKYSEHYAPVTETGFLVRDDWGFRIGYSPDGLVGEDGLIEVKSRTQKRQLQTILDDAVPAENMAQLQCGLLVSGRAWIDYVSYCGGMPLYVKRVEPDPFWHDAIVAGVTRFEDTAAQMLANYYAATDGLAPTERVLDLDMIVS